MRFIYISSLLTAFFPYITVVSFGTDLQPWNLLFVFFLSLILFFNSEKLDVNIGYLMIPFFLALLLSLISISDFKSYVRSLSGYFMIVISPYVYSYVIANRYGLFIKFLKVSTYVWLITALIQRFFYHGFLSIFLNRAPQTSYFHTKGVISLAVEPTFYGIIGIFYLLIFYTLGYTKFKRFIFLWIFQIFVLAQSTMAILFLLIFYTYKMMINIPKYWKYLVICFGVLLMILPFIGRSNFGIRPLKLLHNIMDDGLRVFFYDKSFNNRLSSIYFSFKGFVNNLGLPHGMSSYLPYVTIEKENQSFFSYFIGLSNRIMSFYGSVFFELGIVGIIIPLVYTNIIFQTYKTDMKKFVLYTLFLHTILFTAIPLSFPFIGIYLGLLLYKKKYEGTFDTQQLSIK